MTDTRQSRKTLLRTTILRILFLYVPVPVLLLTVLARPVGGAARASGPAAFLLLFAALGAVGLNWLVYTLIRRKRPPLPVFSHGIFCLLAVIVVEYEALPVYSGTRSTLAVIGGCLTLVLLLLLGNWFASRRSRPAHAAAVGFRILYGLILFFIAWQVLRDIEIRRVTPDTWISIGILIASVPAFNAPRILSAFRRRASRRRAAGLAEGRIVQIVGETHLDLDGDPVTRNHARVLYTVNGAEYETRADISRRTTRKYGREAFVGRAIPVHYNPADPAEAFAEKIDRRLPDCGGESSAEP